MKLVYFFGALLLTLIGISALNNPDLLNRDKEAKTLTSDAKVEYNSATYDSLGLVFEKNNDLGFALKSFELAVKLGEQSGDENLDAYRANLERIKQKMQEL